MIVLEWLLGAYLLAALLYWLWTAWGIVRLRRGVPILAELTVGEPPRWPRLSVVVPARDEADKLPAAAATLLASDYPDLEVVFVDDRSTDGTGRIVDDLAAGDARARAVHVAELPDGWLGKVHALHCGLGECTGELVLFTDADVHFAPDAFRRAVAYLQAERLDLLAAFPDIWPAGLIVDAFIALFLRHFLLFLARPWAVADGSSSAFVGIGAFNLLRRSALEATEGLAWLRMEVGDDMGVGLLMKRHGRPSGVVAAFDLVGLHWHRSVAEAARGAEKIPASMWRLGLKGVVVTAVLLLLLECSPAAALLALAFAPLRAVGWAGAAVAAAFVACCVLLGTWARGRTLTALVAPLAAPVLVGVMVRAAWLGRRRGGVVWRGTHYPAEMLLGGQRLRLGAGPLSQMDEDG